LNIALERGSDAVMVDFQLRIPHIDLPGRRAAHGVLEPDGVMGHPACLVSENSRKPRL
jgi:hypothetical protein